MQFYTTEGAKIRINRNLKFRQNPFSSSGEVSKKFKPIGGQDGHIGSLIGRKNTNFAEGVEDFLSVKLSQNNVQWYFRRSRKCDES